MNLLHIDTYFLLIIIKANQLGERFMADIFISCNNADNELETGHLEMSRFCVSSYQNS